ncbi:MAG: nicotinate-nucleotide--dimethylbenzimidazole phosphoribosyltransferase [Clostridia bacterium]|nr:nicotinate-nucleotide--dimethylbenzimidazole phosphoribosyltransferase [Clostridia bacterium]
MEYTFKSLEKLISGITGPDAEAAEEARKRQAELAKPPGSLGRLEELSVQLAAITGKVKNRFDKRRCWCFARTTAWSVKVLPLRLSPLRQRRRLILPAGKPGRRCWQGSSVRKCGCVTWA